MRFNSSVAGVPCQIAVTRYQQPVPMRITGTGYGDAEPPEELEFEFEVLDRNGYRAPWLARKLTDDDHARILGEYHDLMEEL